MKKIFKSTLVILLVLCSQQFVNAQDADKTVTLVVSGSGKTQDEAKQNALRSAIEQAFGTFISSKTEILNDDLVKDEIVSVANGNIQSYEMLNESQLPDGTWGLTLKALVSVNKLTSFVESKGIAIEIKGGLFALNIKQQILNEQGEVKAIDELIKLLHEPLLTSFDYEIKSEDPKSLDAESKNWGIALAVTATCNINIDFCANYFKKTLAGLSLSSEEVETYKSLKKQVFPVIFTYGTNKQEFYLRSEISSASINSLTTQLDYYTRQFKVQSGIDETIGKDMEGQLYNFKGVRFQKTSIAISFPTIGQCAGRFTWKDKKTLGQIEQMTGYTVKPIGVVSQN
jgi:hypothetical protein